jgi:hypothetical protein
MKRTAELTSWLKANRKQSIGFGSRKIRRNGMDHSQ